MMQRFLCPCCGCRTLTEPPQNSYEICPVCYWENNSIQNNDETSESGANRYSLAEARENYRLFGASDEHLLPYVRKPKGEEIEDEGTK